MPDQDSGRTRIVVTKSAYARHRGVTAPQVSHWAKAGRLVLDEKGNVDVQATDALLAEVLDRTRGGKGGKPAIAREPEVPQVAEENRKPPHGSAQGPTGELTRSKARHADRQADLLELRYQKEVGELTEVSKVRRGVEAAFAAAREALLAVPGRLHSRIAAETDPRACFAMLDAEMRKVTTDLADGLEGLATGAEATRQ